MEGTFANCPSPGILVSPPANELDAFAVRQITISPLQNSQKIHIPTIQRSYFKKILEPYQTPILLPDCTPIAPLSYIQSFAPGKLSADIRTSVIVKFNNHTLVLMEW